MPAGWSWVSGHLLVLNRYTSRFPPLANLNLALQEIGHEFADHESFLLGLWPFQPPVIVTFNPESALLVTQKLHLPKPKISHEMFKAIAGGPNLISMNGNEWKRWRSLFAPGFSSSNVIDHVGYIVELVEIFCDKLRTGSVENTVFSLDDFATRLTFDVIMKITLLVQFNCHCILR